MQHVSTISMAPTTHMLSKGLDGTLRTSVSEPLSLATTTTLLSLPGTRQMLNTQCSVLRGSLLNQLHNCATLYETTSVALEVERTLRSKTEAKARHTVDHLVRENAALLALKNDSEQEVKEAKAAAEVEAHNVQNMQEIAMTAFGRCNLLEAENLSLKQAIHTFAEGSPSATIQSLQKIISDLTCEVALYKKRESDLRAKERRLREKENENIMEEMRSQTKELKRRTRASRLLQSHNQ